MADQSETKTSVSRRSLLKWGVGTVAGVAGAAAIGARVVSEDSTMPEKVNAFDGVNQAGIVTSMQNHLFFAVFEVTSSERADVVQLLKDWTEASRKMTRGVEVGSGAVGGAYLSPPDDTGEALGLHPAGLTVTIGFGPGLFRNEEGRDRFGLAKYIPQELKKLPKFSGEMIDPQRQGGDICVQACADDPQVALHAVRNLARLGFGRVAMKWSQLGYGPSASVGGGKATPRNLFGFKDGTSNIDVKNASSLESQVWLSAGDDAQQWTTSGTYMVVRRINMTIETWDRSSLQEQESVVGRDKAEGAPLSGGNEFTPPNFTLEGGNGSPLIPVDSHVALAHPSNNGGAQMLRRGYNFSDGVDEQGRMDAGLFFIAFVKSPSRQFIPVQKKLATSDAMSEYLRHTGTGIFFVPSGTKKDSYIGSDLFE